MKLNIKTTSFTYKQRARHSDWSALLSLPVIIEYLGKKSREKLIIELRFGLNGDKPKTQKEIAKMMNISRSYVSRIETKAIGKLSKEFKQ